MGIIIYGDLIIILGLGLELYLVHGFCFFKLFLMVGNGLTLYAHKQAYVGVQGVKPCITKR